MKKIIPILTFLLSIVYGISCLTIQDWTWTKGIGGNGDDMGMSIDTDNAGNSYITGSFSGSVAFGSTILTSTSTMDVFVAKMDSNGNCLWAKQSEGDMLVNSLNRGRSIAVDSTGSCYVSGHFTGSMYLGTIQLNAVNTGYALFVAKLDRNGNWIWARQSGGDGNIMYCSNSLDRYGNCYITSTFQNTVTIGTTSMTGGLNGQGINGLFIAKINSEGNWEWATMAVSDHNFASFSSAIDPAGNSYITGYFDYTSAFGSIVVNSIGLANFVAKMDNNGNWLWVAKSGLSDNSSNCYGSSIAVDSMGSCFVTGFFNGSVSFGSTTLTDYINSDLYIAKLDTNGQWLWAIQSGGEALVFGNSVAIKNDGSLNVAGYFRGIATFGSTSLINNDNGGGVFVAEMKSDGNWQWANGTIGNGTDESYVYSMALDYAGSCYLTGYFRGTSIFGSSTLISNGSYDIFVSKLSPSPKITYTPITTFNFNSVYLGTQSIPHEVQIKNIGTAPLIISSISYKLSNTPFEVTDLVLPLQIAIGDSASFHVRFSPQYSSLVNDSLFIHSNAHDFPIVGIKLTGRGEIVPPQAPANITLNMLNNNVILSWYGVTQTIFDTPLIPDCYLIYGNGSSNPMGGFTFLGVSYTNSFTHNYVGMYAPYMFYRIKAFKNYSRGIFIMEDYGLKVGMTEEEVEKILERN